MGNNFYNRGASFNPDELADGDAIEAEFDAVARGFDTIEDLVNVNKAGYPTQTFHVATATESTHAVPKAQMDAGLALKLNATSYTAADVLSKIKTVDGSSSGLDADLLDGQDGAYYRNATNINAGTLDKARLPASVDANTTGNAATATKLATARTINGVAFDGSADITINGGNSDTVDNLHASSFLRSDAGTTFSGGVLQVTTPAGSLGSNTGPVNTLQIYQATLNTDAFQTFHIAGDHAVHFGLDGTTNDLFVGGWSAGAVKNKIWHAGNDGSGSGLDADLLDGQHGSYYRDASNINAGTLAKERLPGTIDSATTGNAATATKVSGGAPVNGAADLITGTMGSNDFFRIRVGGTDNAGEVELATADDGNEPIYVRQYDGLFSSVRRTLTLLDGNGHTVIPGGVWSIPNNAFLNTVSVITGTIAHGGTIPLPSGYSEGQCCWMVSMNNDNPNSSTWDVQSSGQYDHVHTYCSANGTRVVTCYRTVIDEKGLRTQNGIANYIVIGVK